MELSPVFQKIAVFNDNLIGVILEVKKKLYFLVVVVADKTV